MPVEKKLAGCAWAFPIAGLVCGVLYAALYETLLIAGFSHLMSVVLVVAFSVVFTGGLHEDGLADCADGFFGGYERERKLAIMKDSFIGTYGVLALIFAVLLKVSAMLVMDEPAILLPALVAAEVISRGVLPLMMFLLPNAREGGLAAAAGKPTRTQVLVSLKLSLIPALLLLWQNIWLAAVAVFVAFVVVRYLAMKHIGGYTGDVLGLLQQLSVIAILLALSGAGLQTPHLPAFW